MQLIQENWDPSRVPGAVGYEKNSEILARPSELKGK